MLYPFLGLLLKPMVASGAMSFGSASVLGNGLRLKRTCLRARRPRLKLSNNLAVDRKPAVLQELVLRLTSYYRRHGMGGTLRASQLPLCDGPFLRIRRFFSIATCKAGILHSQRRAARQDEGGTGDVFPKS